MAFLFSPRCSSSAGDLPAGAVVVGDPEQLHPGDRHQHRAGIVPGAAAAVPLDLPAVAVAIGDPEQLHQGNDSSAGQSSQAQHLRRIFGVRSRHRNKYELQPKNENKTLGCNLFLEIKVTARNQNQAVKMILEKSQIKTALPGNNSKTMMEQPVQQSPCRSIFSPWPLPWSSAIRSSFTQVPTPTPHRYLPRCSSSAGDLPAVAVVVGDPEQLHPGDRHRDRAGTVLSAAVAVPPIFPPWPWPSVIRSSSTQGTGTETAPEPFRGGAVAVPVIFPRESGLLSLDAGLDLQAHDGKAQPWQRDGFSDSR